MIRLVYPAKPSQLTNEKINELTTKFHSEKTDVWKIRYITDLLLAMSHNKCCFCETNVNEESKYMEVEHFHPKSLYPDEVVMWENLLPICKRCNGKKGDYDTKENPIIHPAKDNPQEHLHLKENYRFKHLTEQGRLTIREVYLNDSERLVKKRVEIGERMIEELIDLLELTDSYINNTSNYLKNRITSKLEKLMREGTEQYEYSATAATVLLRDENYSVIKQKFQTLNLWTADFEELETKVKYCALCEI